MTSNPRFTKEDQEALVALLKKAIKNDALIAFIQERSDYDHSFIGNGHLFKEFVNAPDIVDVCLNGEAIQINLTADETWNQHYKKPNPKL